MHSRCCLSSERLDLDLATVDSLPNCVEFDANGLGFRVSRFYDGDGGRGGDGDRGLAVTVKFQRSREGKKER